MKYKKIFLLIILLTGCMLYSHDWLGRDKVAHFSTSLFLTCWSYGLSQDIFEQKSNDSRYLAVGVTLSMGLGKEGSDRYIRKGKWSWEDLVWDAGGILCGLVLINNKIIE